MHILTADDDSISRTLLVRTLEHWGHQVEGVEEGVEAHRRLVAPGGPTLAILDWSMPGLEGPEVCRQVRAAALRMQPYLVILTSRRAPEDFAVALEAGADDFLSKPFNRIELMARLHAGMRILNLHRALTDRIEELEESRQREHHLRTLTPIRLVLQEDPRRQGRLGADRSIPRRARLPLHARGVPVVPRYGGGAPADAAWVARSSLEGVNSQLPTPNSQTPRTRAQFGLDFRISTAHDLHQLGALANCRIVRGREYPGLAQHAKPERRLFQLA